MSYRQALENLRHFRFHAEHAAFVGMATIAAVILLVLYWVVWPPIDRVFRLTKPITILTKQVISGSGVIAYEMNYCKEQRYEDLHAVVQHTFVDHVIQYSVGTTGTLPTGCHSAVIEIPAPALRPGVYHLSITREYDLSPVRQHQAITTDTDDFTVIAAPSVEIPVDIIADMKQLVTVNQALDERIQTLLVAHRELVEANQQLRKAIKK